MRTWVKASLGAVALVAVGLVALAGTGAYYVLRHLETQAAGETESVKAVEAVRARFGARPPLIEVVDPRTANIRINRPAEPSTSRVATIHIINWKGDTGEMTRAQVPLWLMRFSSLNIASQLGIAPEKFRLTVADIERYGPGIVVDYGSPGALRLLVWVE
jgi:hypothetical protein